MLSWSIYNRIIVGNEKVSVLFWEFELFNVFIDYLRICMNEVMYVKLGMYM